jgi:D-amino-acid dehydrogenase
MSSSVGADSKRAIVIGGGVAGVTTAFTLARRGYRVKVFEARDAVACECSNAGAGEMQLSPINTSRRTFLTALLHVFVPLTMFSDGYFPSVVLDFKGTWGSVHWLRWLCHFSADSLFASDAHINRKTDEMLKFTDFSVKKLSQLMHEYPQLAQASYFGTPGAMKLLYGADSYQRLADSKSALSWSGGGDAAAASYGEHEAVELLDREGVMAREPVLRGSTEGMQGVSGALLQRSARLGHCGLFTGALTRICAEMPENAVEFVYNARVSGFEQSPDGAVTGVNFEGLDAPLPVPGDMPVVLAAGAWTAPLLEWLGFYTPLYPLKGYSLVVNLDSDDASSAPSCILASHHDAVHTTRFGNQLRVGSFSHFAGWDTSESPLLHTAMRDVAKQLYPGLANAIDHEELSTVVNGLRPCTHDGCVLAGKVSGATNLFVNAGPGNDGWKGCMGAASLVSDAIQDKPNDFNPDIVSPKNRVWRAPIFTRLFGL